ncbi:response regulator [Granulosicoccus sp. 3-233]|uniref:two-component system sensor histidine kinase NtrB n=1 Tax=Granulosicoccus sp. 3-233 TaxID=3417969 RepID=UPI003D327AD7
MSNQRIYEVQEILDVMPLMFFQKDTRNCIVRTNQVVADMLGTTVGAMIGTSAEQWFPDEAGDFFSDDLQVMNSRQSRLSIIEQFETPVAGKLWVKTDKHPHYDATGEVDGVLVFSRRVDGRTLDEEQRSELEAQVRYAQKLDSIGVLAAGVAHDFNNYLTIIMAGTEMALDRMGRGVPEALPLEESLKAAHEAARIANQLVTYAGKSPIVSKPINLSLLIHQFSDMLHASVATNVALSFSLDFDIPEINADIAQMHQLLVNVVINASEAIDGERGKIIISTSERHYSARELMNTVIGSALHSGPFVLLTISDTGQGMSAEVMKSVFEPFFSTKMSGRGLGLATVIGTIKGHGGTLHVESTEGQGTTIDLLFPVANRAYHSAGNAADDDRSALSAIQGRPGGHAQDASPGVSSDGRFASISPGTSAQQTDRNRYPILIVDDNSAVRETLQTFLESDGFTVVSTDGSEAALALLRAPEARFSAAVVDYCMPETNGLELFRQIRQLRTDLPFILVSGSANLDSMEQFESLSGVAFLKKPFNRGAILEKLKDLLENSHAERAD